MCGAAHGISFPISPRIVSLLPAATEIVVALGLQGNLVGRSHQCDEPASVASLPALTAARIDALAPSREIHDHVTQVGRALSGETAERTSSGKAAYTIGSSAALYSLDVDTLASLKPDLILTQAACDVCAISAADVEAAVRKAGVNTKVMALSPATLADLLADILAVGNATGRLARAREVVARLRARIASVASRVSTVSERPRVAVVDRPQQVARPADGSGQLGARDGPRGRWLHARPRGR